MRVFQPALSVQVAKRRNLDSPARQCWVEGGPDESRSDGTRNIWGGNRSRATASADQASGSALGFSPAKEPSAFGTAPIFNLIISEYSAKISVRRLGYDGPN